MATSFEQQMNAINKFITVDDKITITHAERILKFFIAQLEKDKVFKSLFQRTVMAGKYEYNSYIKRNDPWTYLYLFVNTF